MLLKDVLAKKSKDVHTISSNASADDVVTELVRFNIGSLLVRDSPRGPILGIITERDILRALAAHGAPLQTVRNRKGAASSTRPVVTDRMREWRRNLTFSPGTSTASAGRSFRDTSGTPRCSL